MSRLAGAIDYWCNAFMPDRQRAWQQAIDNQGLSLKVWRDGDEFADPAAMVARLDAAGFATVVLPACDLHDAPEVDSFEHVACRPDEVAELAALYPGRFYGLWSVNPNEGDFGIERAAAMLAEPWCLGLHNHTHSWDRRFDDAAFTPYYELCATEDVPFVMQAGASGGNFPHECGHPDGIDAPATSFDSVRFVLSHTGAPWTTETIERATRYPNVYMGTATWPPGSWSPEVLAFAIGPGHAKLLYGSGFPTSGHAQASRHFAHLDLPADVVADITTKNAHAVFTRLNQLAGDR